MLSRRALIGKAAVGAAATVVLSAARTGLASTRGLQAADDRDAGNSPPPTDAEAIAPPPPWELVSLLTAGSLVGHGWRLADLSPVRDGSCVVTLENERGRSHRVHLCRNDGTPQGLVHTRRVDLIVMNGGQGDLATEEGLAQAVAALAHVVAANEATMPESVFAGLLPHAERVRRFAAADGPSADGKLR